MSECYEGWAKEDGNIMGTCCCNCRYLKPIVAHPWNKHALTKNRITTIIGYGCNSPEMEATVFFDKKHSMCEMHEFKDNAVVKLKRVK
jgi:hypothetical protein